ncbi:MAG: rhomboid family intramembrane serine protease [Syntrophorhabdus sp.]
MIPIRDNIATRTFPIITASLIFVNILIFLWMRFTLTSMEGQFVYKYYGLVPREFITSLSSRLDLVPYNVMTVFSSMFLHGGFFHIGGNMLYLWIFGNNIEDAMGHGRFIFFYLLAGIVAAFAQLLYDPASNIPMIGASGAVSGVLGAYLVLYPYARIKTLLFIIIFIKVVELPAVVLLTIWFFMQVLYSSLEGVAWYAHIGGFIFGLVMIKLFSRKPLSKGSKMRG